MKRLVTLALCLLPSLALAIPPYPTVWYREQTVRNTADIRALEAATDALEESTVAHATDTDNPHGVTAGQIGGGFAHCRLLHGLRVSGDVDSFWRRHRRHAA